MSTAHRTRTPERVASFSLTDEQAAAIRPEVIREYSFAAEELSQELARWNTNAWQEDGDPEELLPERIFMHEESLRVAREFAMALGLDEAVESVEIQAPPRLVEKAAIAVMEELAERLTEQLKGRPMPDSIAWTTRQLGQMHELLLAARRAEVRL
jgi:hypothetical protein